MMKLRKGIISIIIMVIIAASFCGAMTANAEEANDDTQNITEKTDLCSLEEHEHTEKCYEPQEAKLTCESEEEGHVHTEDCYNVQEPKLICEKEEHTHEETCFTAEQLQSGEAYAVNEIMPESEDVVTTLNNLLENIPSAKEILERYANAYGNTERYTEYAEKRDQAVADAKKAIELYDSLTDELKEEIKNYNRKSLDLVAALTDPGLGYNMETGITFKMPENVGENYVYQFSSDCYYQSSMNYALEDNVVAFLMVDTSDYDEEPWKPNSRDYEQGISNYEVAFCCDNITSANEKWAYKRVNLEDSTYYGEDEAEHIRAIVQNSYPFTSADEMRDILVGKNVLTTEEAAKADEGQLLTAVQCAIWHFANEIPYDADSWSLAGWLDYGPGYFGNELKPIAEYYENSEEANSNIRKIYQYLINAAPKKTENIIISDVAYEAYKMKGTDSFDVVVRILLNTEIQSDDDIEINISVEGTDNQVVLKPTEGREFMATLADVNAESEINVDVSGTQQLEKDVYFYEPWPNDNKDNPQRGASQSLVGAASGETKIHVSHSFKVRDAKDGIDIVLLKKGSDNKALEAAEFELSYIAGDGSKLPIKNSEGKSLFVTDENGKIYFKNLMPGNYVLTETKAPSGYIVSQSEKETEFIIVDGDAGVTVELKNNFSKVSVDGTVLTINNDKEEGKEVDKEDEDNEEEQIEERVEERIEEQEAVQSAGTKTGDSAKMTSWITVLVITAGSMMYIGRKRIRR